MNNKHVQLIKYSINVYTCNHGAQKVRIKAWKIQSLPGGPLRGRPSRRLSEKRDRGSCFSCTGGAVCFTVQERLLRLTICENTFYKTDTLIKWPFLKATTVRIHEECIKLIKSDIKDIYNVTKMSISNKCCSFELSIDRELKNFLLVSTKY